MVVTIRDLTKRGFKQKKLGLGITINLYIPEILH